MCLNCLNCKLKIVKDKKTNMYYLGFYCSKNQLRMTKKSYSFILYNCNKKKPDCIFYNPMENNFDWINDLRRKISQSIKYYHDRRDVVLP